MEDRSPNINVIRSVWRRVKKGKIRDLEPVKDVKGGGGGDLPWALRSQLTSLRDQTEAVETGFKELEARIQEIQTRIKEREARIKERKGFRSAPENKANSRTHRSLTDIVGLLRRRKIKRRMMTAAGVHPVIRIYDQGGNFSGFLDPLGTTGTAGPSAPDSISEGAVHSPSLAKQQTRRENT